MHVNAQGLTNLKLIELQELVDNKTILCLTEIQQKVDKLNSNVDLDKFLSMRKLGSKKGGEIMILKKKTHKYC